MKDIDYRVYEALALFNNFKMHGTEVIYSLNTGRQLYLHNSKVYWIDLNDDVFFSLRGYDTNLTRSRINAGLKLNDCKVFKRLGNNYILLSNGSIKDIDINKEYSLSELLR